MTHNDSPYLHIGVNVFITRRRLCSRSGASSIFSCYTRLVTSLLITQQLFYLFEPPSSATTATAAASVGANLHPILRHLDRFEAIDVLPQHRPYPLLMCFVSARYIASQSYEAFVLAGYEAPLFRFSFVYGSYAASLCSNP